MTQQASARLLPNVGQISEHHQPWSCTYVTASKCTMSLGMHPQRARGIKGQRAVAKLRSEEEGEQETFYQLLKLFIANIPLLLTPFQHCSLHYSYSA